MVDVTDGNLPPTISVLGLGAMGASIARAATAQGQRVVAWNRTLRSPEEFGFQDAGSVEVVSSPCDAVVNADLVVVCVRDHDASRAVVTEIASRLGGRVVVNISTGTPSEAVVSAKEAMSVGVRYVTGAVMVPTPLVGTDQALVIYAGAETDITELGPLFSAMQGVSDVVGEDHAVPPALDMAMLDIYFAGMYAHLHATVLADSHDIEPKRFLPFARGIVETLGASLGGLASAVERRKYDGGEARLDMCLSFLEKIVASSRESGIDPGPAELVRAASARALMKWAGSTDWDVVAEDFFAEVQS